MLVVGYQPDSDVENCRISTIATTSINKADDLSDITLSNIQTSLQTTLPGSLTVSPSSNLSKSMSSMTTLSEMTDGNNNEDHIPPSTTSRTHIAPDALSNLQTKINEKSSNEYLHEINVKGDFTDCTEAMENSVTPAIGITTTDEIPTTKIIRSSQNLFSSVVDDDEDEDDYLILSNGSMLFGGFADAAGNHHLTSTPERKGLIIYLLSFVSCIYLFI